MKITISINVSGLANQVVVQINDAVFTEAIYKLSTGVRSTSEVLRM